jgi:hypothetical protein
MLRSSAVPRRSAVLALRSAVLPGDIANQVELLVVSVPASENCQPVLA